MSLLCQAYKHGRQHCKYIRLDECHQQLQEVHEYHKEHRHGSHTSAHRHTHMGGYEYDAADAQDYRVPGKDVGKKTHHQSEGLGKDAYDFNDGHQRYGLQENGYVGPENLLVVVLAAKQVHRQHCGKRHKEGYGDIAGDVGAAREERHQPQQVAHKNTGEFRSPVFFFGWLLFFLSNHLQM